MPKILAIFCYKFSIIIYIGWGKSMPLSSNSIVGSDFGSRYMYLKFLNSILENQNTRRSNNSLISEAYRDMFFSEYYYANNILERYFDNNFLTNDDAVIYERTGIANATSNLSLLNYMFNQYEPDSIIPENSTVSYHV